MTKIKILQYTGAMNRAGAETLLMNIFRSIDRNRFEFHFITHSMQKCDYDDEIIELGGKIHYISPPNMKNIASFKNDFSMIVRKNGPYHAIHAHQQLLNGLILREAYKCNIPNRISHAHLNGDYIKGSILRDIYRRYSKYLIHKYATFRIACSEEAGEFLYRGEKFLLLNNAINLDNFDLNEKKLSIKKELHILEKDKIITNIARFVDAKNHSFLINLFKELLEEDDNYSLLLVGDGPLKDSIIEKAKSLNIDQKVYFLGVRDDIPSILMGSDVFVMPSLLEGLPVVLVEAQAAGVPCIISDNIPSQCDLGLGLVSKLSLEDTNQFWIDKIQKVNSNSLSFDQRRQIILQKGYDLSKNIEILTQIYSS